MRVRALENVIYAGEIYAKGTEFEVAEKSGLLTQPWKVEVVDKQVELPPLEVKRKK